MRYRKSTLQYGGSALLAVTLLAGLAAPAQAAVGETWNRHSLSSRFSDRHSLSSADRRFLEDLISHHQEAIDLAEIALRRAEHPEIRDLARRIIRNELSEIERLLDVYRDLLDRNSLTVRRRDFRWIDRDSHHLNTSFDRVFLNDMISQRRRSSQLARILHNHSDRPELRRLALDQLDGRNRDLNQLLHWHNAWYR
jgi:predicted outer membrane protein